MEIVKCLGCGAEVEWTSNKKLEEEDHWALRDVKGAVTLVCPVCAEKYYEPYRDRRRGWSYGT